MTHAYHEMFLRRAMISLGEMFDFAVNDFGMDRDDFAEVFACSSAARRLGLGDVKYLAGMSGVEIAVDVIEEMTGVTPVVTLDDRYDRTPDYWCGWAIAYYQWLKGISYSEIFGIASYDEISAMYPVLHEADVSKFADVMDERKSAKLPETRLKRTRMAYGCSQSELAEMSGVSLRSIQMYEQRNKDINKSQSETVLRLAGALGCSVSDLLEYA